MPVDFELGAHRFLTRLNDNPELFIKNLRNAEDIAVLSENGTHKFMPLAWILATEDDGWETSTYNRHNAGTARAKAQEQGITPVNKDSPTHDEWWEQSNIYLSSLAGQFQLQKLDHFSMRENAPRQPFHNTYYLVTSTSTAACDPDKIPSGFEGAATQITSNGFERNPKNRAACIDYTRKENNGRLPCRVCDLDFGERFGDFAAGFIHIHHVNPLANIKAKHSVDPTKDLVPVCPNCHAMAHKGIKTGELPRSIDELKKILHE